MKKRRSALSSISQFCFDIKVSLNEKVADIFGRWAEIAYDYPYLCIATTLLITLICSIGFIPGIPQWVDGAEALYSLPFSEARTQGLVHDIIFNETASRPTFILVTGKNEGENILTWKHLDAVYQLDRLIRGETIDPVTNRRVGIPIRSSNNIKKAERTFKNLKLYSTDDSLPGLSAEFLSVEPSARLSEDVEPFTGQISIEGQKALHEESQEDFITFQDLCIRNAFGDCSVSGIQELDLLEMKKLMPDSYNDLTIFLFEGLMFNLRKKVFPPHYFLGQATEIPCSPDMPLSILSMMYKPEQIQPGSSPSYGKVDMTCITESKAFQLIYELQSTNTSTDLYEKWERSLIDVLSANLDFGPIKISMNAFRSRDDALRSSTSESSDILFVGLTFGLLLAYSTGLNFSCNLYRSKAYPALAGLMAATLGLIAGMGFMSLCQIAFVPTALVCPFLVIGVGTDDLFVILNGYSMTYMLEGSRRRCVITLRETAFGITITTVTSLVTFLIGLNTSYLSIKNFCWFAGAGMFFGYIFVFTLFFPIHCLDAQREEKNLACFFFSRENNETTCDGRESVNSDNTNTDIELSIFTVGALMVRREEQQCIYRYAKREEERRIREAQANVQDHKQNGVYKDSIKIRDKKKNNNLDFSRGAKKLSELSADHHDMDTYQNKSSFRQDKTFFNMQYEDDETQATQSTTTQSPNTMNFQSKSPERSNKYPKYIFKSFGKLLSKLIQLFYQIEDFIEETSDRLVSQIALHAHEEGLKYTAEDNLTPSHGILSFKKLDPEFSHTDDILQDILHFPDIPLHYTSLVTGQRKQFVNEPKGNVGLFWHKFFIRYYGAILTQSWFKVLVLVAFFTSLCISIYGVCNLESGLDLKDLSTEGSYLNIYDLKQAQYFDQYDYPVDIFFPEFHEWWKLEAQQSLRTLESLMQRTGSGKLATNPLIRMLDDPDLKEYLQSGDQKTFQTTLYHALTNPTSKYKQFEQNFVWQGNSLRAWKMQVLPGAMLTSAERAAWMIQLRKDCESMKYEASPLDVRGYNYMMTFYESDLRINSSVITNMMAAAATMLVIALVAIPQSKAGFLVIIVMGMIDIAIVGYMYFCSVKLNMVSMICLLIAVGFSVDFSCHICHAYMETEGETRDQRVLETLVIMGNPVLHGAISSILGVMMLGFSASYIFKVFFKMMALVIILALLHGIIFLPVLLSVLSDKRPHHAQQIGIIPQPSIHKNKKSCSIDTNATRQQQELQSSQYFQEYTSDVKQFTSDSYIPRNYYLQKKSFHLTDNK